MWWLVVAVALGPTFAIDEPAVGGAAGRQTEPVMASDDAGSTLVVWRDERLGPLDETNVPASIYAARVSAEGTVLDPGGIAISFDGIEPAVASSGSEFLVVWVTGFADVTNRFFGPGTLVAVRVSADGQLVDASPLILAESANAPRMAFDGDGYVVVWEQEGAVWLSTVSVGAVAGVPLRISDGARPDVACVAGVSCVVTWIGQGGVARFQTVRLDGTVGSPQIVGATQGGAVVESAGQFVLIWVDESGLLAQQVSTEGDFVGSLRRVYLDSTAGVRGVAAASTPSGILVTWVEYAWPPYLTRLRGVRLALDGTVLDPEPIALGYGSHIAAGGVGDAYLVVNGGWDVLGQRWSAASGAALDADPFPVARAANNQYAPAAARAGDNILVAWVDERRAGEAWIYAARVGSDGQRLDDVAIPIDRLEHFDYRYDHHRHPITVVSDGTDFVVAWTEVTDDGVHMFGARLNGQGELLGPPVLLGRDAASLATPKIAFGRDGYALLWLTGAQNIVRLRRFTAALEPLDDRDLGPFFQDYVFEPLLVRTQEHWLVITRPDWQCTALRIGFDGEPLDGGVGSECGYGLVAEPSGRTALVLSIGAGASLVGDRGRKLESYSTSWGYPFDDLSGKSGQHDGKQYAVAFGTIERTDDRSNWWPQTRRRDVAIGFVSPSEHGSCLSMTNLTPELLPVADEPTDETSPVLVPGDRAGESIVFYARHDLELNAFRITGRVVTPAAADFAAATDEGCYPEQSSWGCHTATPRSSGALTLLVGLGLCLLALAVRKSRKSSNAHHSGRDSGTTNTL